MNTQTLSIVFGLVLGILLSIPAAINAQTADYGDAPDGGTFGGQPLNFPSLDASNGPKHEDADISTFWISKPQHGTTNSTDEEADADIENLDIDNGRPFVFITLIGIPAPSNISIPVTTSPGHNPATPIYINAAIDVDNDFDYDNNPDPNWVVNNKVITQPADTTIVYTYDGFGFGSDLLLLPVWLRATVTDQPVGPGWHQGAGGVHNYPKGETEDHFLALGNPSIYPDDWVNPPNDPPDEPEDSLPKKPKKPKPQKCADLSYPKVVYVGCDEVKCFFVEVENCGSDTLTDVGVSFQFSAGTPLQSGPTVVSATEIPPNGNADDLEQNGDKLRFEVCVTGWPCTSPSEGHRWARYKIKMKFDPDGLYYVQDFDLLIGNNEDQYRDTTFSPKVACAPYDSLNDLSTWKGEINQPFSKQLYAFTGYNFGGVMRWIQGTPNLQVLHMPAWATFTPTPMGPDTTLYTLSGTPGQQDNGRDSLVVLVGSDDPADTSAVEFWEYKEYIDIYNVNNVPDVQALNSSYDLCANFNDVLNINLSATDADITSGKRDTTFLDYYIEDGNGNTYEPVNAPTFVDNGDGTGSLSWQPTTAEAGTYTLNVVGWDYYLDYEVETATVNVEICGSIEDAGIPAQFVLQSEPNPFRSTTLITFGLPSTQAVTLEVFSLDGKKVATLAEGDHTAGFHQVSWNAGDLAAGVYLYKLTAGDKTIVKKGNKLD